MGECRYYEMNTIKLNLDHKIDLPTYPEGRGKDKQRSVTRLARQMGAPGINAP